MIYRLIDLPSNLIGFIAQWQVTKKDCDEVLLPSVHTHVKKTGHLSCLLVLKHFNDSFKLFTLKNLKHLMQWKSQWRRIAIVVESKAIKMVVVIANLFVPGKFRVFSNTEMDKAIEWASERS
ncbi:MAG: STAS/SEC14 domain-containing protein [Bacteroidota bacterium]